jgi:mannan endo-1,4-beta-mannosidase
LIRRFAVCVAVLLAATAFPVLSHHGLPPSRLTIGSPTPQPTATPSRVVAAQAAEPSPLRRLETGVVRAAPPRSYDPPGFVTRHGSRLFLDGNPYRFTGVNAYELATLAGTNWGCGPTVTNAALDGLFSSLRPNSLVRVWAWQGCTAVNVHTKKRDWTGIDRVVDAAARHGQRLVLVLGGNNGIGEDGHWKDRSWYGGGYRLRFNEDARTPQTTSYWAYVRDIVRRFRDSRAVAVWEPVNEPNAIDCDPGVHGPACAESGNWSCDHDRATKALRSFFDHVGQEIKRIAPNHLVGSGFVGGAECGVAGNRYRYVHASPGIDVASYHDYWADKPLSSSELKDRLSLARALGKPLMIGEAGMRARDGRSDCTSTASRRNRIRDKLRAQFPAGVSGFLVWNWVPAPDPGCTFDVGPGDPIMRLLRDFRPH